MDLMTRVRSQWDRLLAMAALVAGAMVLILGWLGVSGTPYPAEQLPYVISGGLGGLFLLGISAALWLSADLHDEWRKLDRIEQAIRATEFDDRYDTAAGFDVDFGRADVPGHATDRELQQVSGEIEPERTRRIPRVAAESAR